MPKDFNCFMSQLRETNRTLGFLCDFDKISQNVDDVRLSLCMLDSLIGSTNLRRSVEVIWARDRRAFEVLDILVAVRKRDKSKVVDAMGNCRLLDSYFDSVDSVVTFLRETGLAEVFANQKIRSLVDYVFGIETGLDTNARKNRSGALMEQTVARIFAQSDIPFRREVYSREWPAVRRVLGDDEKRFDFAVEMPRKTYLIEVNFYSGGGSKLNEVARSYSDIGPKVNLVDGFEFVWITDGVGWRKAENKLREAYTIIPSVYNLTSITEFIEKIKS